MRESFLFLLFLAPPIAMLIIYLFMRKADYSKSVENNNWINMNHEPPPEGVTVLTYNGLSYGLYYSDKEQAPTQENDESPPVTHWALLPAPPEPDK